MRASLAVFLFAAISASVPAAQHADSSATTSSALDYEFFKTTSAADFRGRAPRPRPVHRVP